MFFITTDTSTSVDKLFSRIFSFHPSSERKMNTIVVKRKNLNAIFYNCQKVEFGAYTVIICGYVFPKKDETLVSSLKKVVQKKTAADALNGNFNLIVFNKDCKENNPFFIIGDRYGTIPVFFSQEDDTIKISSVLHLLLLNRENDFNEQSLLDYLCLGYTLPGESLWNAIKMLPKDKLLTVSSSCLILENRESELNEKNKSTVSSSFISLKECAFIFCETLRDIITDEINFMDVGCMLLTGGSDTRVLLSCMSDEQRNKLLYLTYDHPRWSNTNNDLLVAKLIAKELNLNHKAYSNYGEKDQIKLPQTALETQYVIDSNSSRYISGQFGSELFGGASFDKSLFLDYFFSRRIDDLKNKLLNSLVTVELYQEIGSPWNRLKWKILSMDSVSKEASFIWQMLLRSQFTQIYSRANVNSFIIPSKFHFCGGVLPYIDTRIIDFFLRCPREFLLNYSLYEYILIHFSDKRLREIPFHSNMMKFVETLKKTDKTEPVLKNVGTYSGCNYREYFERKFNPLFFDGTFLSELSNRDSHRLPEPFLSRICDLNCFISGIQSR